MGVSLEVSLRALADSLNRLISGESEIKIQRDANSGTKIDKIFVQSKERY